MAETKRSGRIVRLMAGNGSKVVLDASPQEYRLPPDHPGYRYLFGLLAGAAGRRDVVGLGLEDDASVDIAWVEWILED